MLNILRTNYNEFFLTANAEATTFAIRTSIGMVTATFFAFLFHFSAPYWAVITIIMLMNSYAGLAIQKGVYRIIATIAGAIIGLMMSRYIDNIYTLLIATFLVITVFQYLTEVSSYHYVFLLSGITIFLVLGSVVSGPEVPVQMAVWRCAEILLGVIIVVIIAICVFPKDPVYWVHLEAMNFFDCFNNGYKNIISSSLTGKNIAKNKKQLNELSTILANLKTHYDAYCQEPSRELSHVYAMKDLINILKKLQNVLKLMSLAFSGEQKYYWVDLFKESIEKISTSIEAIFSQLSKSELYNITVDADLLLTAKQAIEEFKQKIALIRKSKEIYNYSVFDNQALYVFLIHQQQLVDMLQIFNERKKVDIQAINEFGFSKIFSFKKDAIIIKHSIKTGIACALAMFIWVWGGWPGGLQGIVSAIVIATNLYISDMWQTSLRRLLGCVLGGAVGLISLHFLIYNITDILITVFVIGFIFAFYTNRSKKYSYIALQANFAFALTLIQAGGPTDSIQVPLGRLCGIGLGILAMMVVNYMIWPLNSKKMLFEKVQTLAKNFSKSLNQSRTSLLEGRFSENFAKLQTELDDCNKLYSAISSTLNEDIPKEKAIVQQLNNMDFILINLSVILQYSDLIQALNIGEKINVNLKKIMLQALALVQYSIDNPAFIRQNDINEFRELVLKEYNYARKSKGSSDYSMEEMANFSYVVYQLRLLVEDIKINVQN